MAAGEYELALKAYLRAASEDGVNADVLSAIGSANLKLGRLGQAEQILRRALEMDPTFVPALNNLGVVLMERGQDRRGPSHLRSRPTRWTVAQRTRSAKICDSLSRKPNRPCILTQMRQTGSRWCVRGRTNTCCLSNL